MRAMTKPTPMLLSLATVLFVAIPAHAQDEDFAQSASPPQKMSILYTYGDEPCPEPQGNEIVVCAQQPESDRYRVPKDLRHEDDEAAPAGGGSWGSKVEGNDDIARLTRPNSCSPVGSYGYTGCAAAALRQWFAERRAMTR